MCLDKCKGKRGDGKLRLGFWGAVEKEIWGGLLLGNPNGQRYMVGQLGHIKWGFENIFKML